MIQARVLRDSYCNVEDKYHRLTTMEVTFPRFILAELNTHRMFSRNTASSRAIPTRKLIERVRDSPFVFARWLQNESGMSATEELPDHAQVMATSLWCEAARRAASSAQYLLDTGVHKQQVNRLLEPFLYVTAIVSATEWENFFNLRSTDRNPDCGAQPEMSALANSMLRAYNASHPECLSEGEWHLPLTEDLPDSFDRGRLFEISDGVSVPAACLVSAGRCARVSYLSHDKDRPVSHDIELALRLLSNRHLSPFEHIATPSVDPDADTGNFFGWLQLRKMVPGERGTNVYS